MKKTTFLVALVAFAFAGCKKDDNCKKDVATIAGSYKVTAAKYKANSSTPEVDYMDYLFEEACEKDNIIKLNADGTSQTIESGTVCEDNDSGDVLDETTWSAGENTLTVGSGEEAVTYTISSFNCKNLVLTSPVGLAEGDQVIVTFTKQ